MSLGSRLKIEREKKGWSQIFVSEKIGITNTVLSNYERDYRDPDTETLKKIADLYHVSTDYLLERDDVAAGQKKDYVLNDGRAFYGGADEYSEEELEIANAAAKAAIEAYRKGRQKGK